MKVIDNKNGSLNISYYNSGYWSLNTKMGSLVAVIDINQDRVIYKKNIAIGKRLDLTVPNVDWVLAINEFDEGVSRDFLLSLV